jgi:arabinose-5-phosphate isomerase
MDSYQDIARQVLALEAECVNALVDRIDDSFDRAVDLIYSCNGRVVVTGMGKCGIIGRKISATLASTGTPSVTVHPAEAIHGDLGMITANDCIMALSNSGETEELVCLLPIFKKIGSKVLAITGNPDSTLAKFSDIVLDASVSREACPYNLAPTASTTAQLAMGDALAMALLNKRKFTPEDYAQLHPGGRLGQRLLKVEDVMRTGDHLAQVSPETKVRDVIVLMTKTRNGAAVITDASGTVIGCFTDGDLRRTILEDSSVIDMTVGSVMTKNPTTINVGHLAVEAAHIMRSGDRKFSQLPVIDDNQKLVGLLDDDELLNL